MFNWVQLGGSPAPGITPVYDISNRFRSAITDIRALSGRDSGSHHNLLKINFKVKLRVKTEKQYYEKRKIVNIFKIQSGNKNMLQNLIIDFKYRIFRQITRALSIQKGLNS